MYLHLVHRAAEKFLPKQADSVADSGQSADLRTGKGIYITIEWQRIADFSVFRTYGQKFIRIELHDPDRAIDEEKPDCQRAYALANEILWIPYAITASTVDIGTAELEKILREYLQASREKSAAN